MLDQLIHCAFSSKTCRNAVLRGNAAQFCFQMVEYRGIGLHQRVALGICRELLEIKSEELPDRLSLDTICFIPSQLLFQRLQINNALFEIFSLNRRSQETEIDRTKFLWPTIIL